VLAAHDGIHRFTIGQRRGLGIGGGGAPRYVAGIDAASGTVRVATSAGVVAAGLVATQPSWIGEPPRAGDAVSLKIRSRFAAQAARVERVGEERFVVSAPDGLRAVTPGQAAVLYDGERVIGGGWIERALDLDAARSPLELEGRCPSA
jgi:tRNA-uridine 2-sulfurtransferase